MRTMKNLKTSLEPLQTFNLVYQYYLFTQDQQPVRKDQLPVQFLVSDEDSEYSDEKCTKSGFSKDSALPDL